VTAPPTPRADDRPLLFIAFSHNKLAKKVADQLVLEMEYRRKVRAYRAIDDPRPGESITGKIHGAIDRADGIAILWSEKASKSARVRDEYRYAKSVGRNPCLIRFPGVALPEDWDPDVEWVPLEGVSFPGGIAGIVSPVVYWPPWQPLCDLVAKYAYRERDRRRAV
jgi:hypothetical protein